MANRLSYDEAKRLAKDIIRRGQNNGVPLAQLIKDIMLPADPGQNVRPEVAGRSPFPQGAGGLGGVYKAVPPEQVAQLAGPATTPPPVTVTPGSAAPLKPGVEIKAPSPKQYESPYLLRARQMAEQFAAMAPPGENAGIDQQAAYDLAKRKAERAQAEADITEGAKIRPEEEEIFAGREARVGEKLADLEKERKSSKWKALAEAGFKMAQSNSPYFMQALASGMEAGVKGYDARKANMDERDSLLKEQTENVKLGRIRAIDTARAVALDAYRAGDKAALEDYQSLTVARENAVSGKTAGSRVEAANLAPVALQADITQKEASADRDRAAADLARRTDPNIRSSGSYGPGTTGLGTKGAAATLNALIRQESAYAKIAADRFAPADQRAAAAAELKKVRQQITWVKAAMTIGGDNATVPTGGGAPQANMLYVPGKGVVPAK
jgi:hypothetical protein